MVAKTLHIILKEIDGLIVKSLNNIDGLIIKSLISEGNSLAIICEIVEIKSRSPAMGFWHFFD